MKKMKCFAALVLFIAVLTSNSIMVFAANPWPNLSSSSYCEYTATKKINIYQNKDCTTRGTESPSKRYNAYIEKGDVCYIYKITSKYTRINYPTSNGRRTGYAKTKDVFSVKNPEISYAGHDGKLTTYISPDGKKIGFTEENDAIFVLTHDGKYQSILYTAKNGKRAYKYGWIKYDGWWWVAPEGSF